MRLTNFQLATAVAIIESGGLVSLFVQKTLDGADEAAVDAEIERAYDAAEMP